MTAFEDTGALAADLLACLDDPLLSRRICDVHFVLQPVEDSGNDSACANGSDDECVDGLCPPPLCVPAISAVVAARSPGLRSLLGGDLRAGWVGLAALPTTGGPGASELPIDMPGTPFSASGVEAVRGREREDTPRTLLPLPGPDWGPAEFNMMIRHLHGAPALFTSNETGDKTALHLALCADHFGVFGEFHPTNVLLARDPASTIVRENTEDVMVRPQRSVTRPQAGWRTNLPIHHHRCSRKCKYWARSMGKRTQQNEEQESPCLEVRAKSCNE
eukprot:SAG31_NODE_2833_length_5023_cov_2.514216_8_plen_275_part_00